MESSGYQKMRVKNKGEILVKGYKLSVIKFKNSGKLMYSMIIIVNNTTLYTFKLLIE